MDLVLIAVNSQYIHSNPALYSLARAIEDMPIKLGLKEYSINMSPQFIVEDLYKLRPNILAFSMYIWNREFILSLIEDLALLLPNCRFMLGGPEASADSEKLLANNTLLDAIICGEGEQVWPQLISALANGELKPQLDYIHWQGGTKPKALARVDLATLPFLYKQEDLQKFKQENKVIYYESSRGCPYSCTFCASAKQSLSERPLATVLKELTILAEYGGQIKFVDRTFNANLKRAMAISQKILELYRPGLSWHFEISPYQLAPQLSELWQKAPLNYLHLEAGLQSLSEPVLAAIRRKGAWPQAEQALKSLLKADNCAVHVDLIAGLPAETEASFAAGFNLVHQIAPHYLQLGFLKILPGSLIAEQTEQYGLLSSPHPPYKILATPNLNADYLFKLNWADKALNQLFNSGRFRFSLLRAAKLWPGDALAMYLDLGAELAKGGLSGLSLQQKAELLYNKLLPLNRDLFFDLLRLDWLSYQNRQNLPHFLRHPKDSKQAYYFNFSWQIKGDFAQENPGSSYLFFDYQDLQGICGRAKMKKN